jgi:predicted metal-dependent peptidase
MNLVETFIIVIDTSGSCCGSTLQNFLVQTKKVVEDMELSGRKFLLRMMQCDYDIQEEVEIRTVEEFNEYIEHFRMRGGGGTNFVPVFRRVDQLVAEEEAYAKLKGFLYFSDGFGDFPNQPSVYETVFVIPEEDFQYHPVIPDWVTVACLKEESLDLI